MFVHCIYRASRYLEIAPAAGWVPAWRSPCIAVVVVGSVAISLLVLWLLVSKEQHNRLLKAMLPGKVIKQLQVRSGQGTCMLSYPMSRDAQFKRPLANCQGYFPRVRSSLCAVFAATDLLKAANATCVQAGENAIAQEYSDVTVLFSDIVSVSRGPFGAVDVRPDAVN